MKKRILMLGAVAFMLAACGNKSSNPSTDSSSSTDPAHEHTISETWSSNADGHWKTCSGCDAKFEEGEHTFAKKSDTPSEDGKSYTTTYECTTCGYTYDETFLTQEASLAKLAEDKTKSADKTDLIKTGTYSYSSPYTNLTTGEFEYGTYGDKKAFKQSLDTDTTYLYYEGETICGYKVNSETGYVSQFGYSAPTENDFKGVHFTTGFYAPTYNGNIYSIDPIFDNVYQDIVSNSNSDLKLSYSVDKNAYSYSLGAIRAPYGMNNYYTLEGTIEFDSETGAIVDYASDYAQYYANEIVLDDELGTFEVVAGKEKEPNKFAYAVELGERGAIEIPYTYDDFKFTSFSLSYNNEPIASGSTVEVELTTTSVNFALDSRTPTSASPDFDKFSISIVDKDTGTAVNGYAAYTSYNNSFMLPAEIGKTYTATITTTSGASFTFSYKGKAPAPTSIDLMFCTIGPAGNVQTGNFESKVYIGKPVFITASVNPMTADRAYTLTCKNDAGETITLEKLTGSDWSGKPVDYYKFDMQTAGTYTITVTSNAKDTVTTTKTIEVCEAPSLDQIFTGKYYYLNMRGSGEIELKCEFTPNTETEAIDGTLTLTSNPGKANEKVATYSYVANAAGDGVDCTKVSGESNYYSVRFETDNNYAVNMCFTRSEGEAEETMGLKDESQIPENLR